MIEEGNYRINFRVETHNKVNNVFKELHLNKSDYVRHANIQFYTRVEGKWVPVKVPGTATENYHIFLNLLDKYN